MNPSEALEAVKHMIIPTIQQVHANHKRCSVKLLARLLDLKTDGEFNGLREYMRVLRDAGIVRVTGKLSGTSWHVVNPDIDLPDLPKRKPYRKRKRTVIDTPVITRLVGEPIAHSQYHAGKHSLPENEIARLMAGRRFEDHPRAVRINAPEYSHLRRRNEQN